MNDVSDTSRLGRGVGLELGNATGGFLALAALQAEVDASAAAGGWVAATGAG